MGPSLRHGHLIFTVALLVALLVAPSAYADRKEEMPKELEGVGILECLGVPLPLQTEFLDDLGNQVTLGDYFHDGKPVILTMNYSNCPMLCNLQLTGLTESLRELDWTAGDEFTIVTISIDPLETLARARLAKTRYVGDYGRASAARGWHFLTGKEANIKAVADRVGFHYRYSAERKEYLHAAALILCTPQGTVSRYLYGIKYEPRLLHLSLVETSQGKLGSTLDQILLFCFHYDSAKGRYGLEAQRLMRAGAVVTMLVLATYLTRTWLRSQRPETADRLAQEPAPLTPVTGGAP